MSEILDQLQLAIMDRYLVERELGRGGMATVYLATDVRHDRRVAIKVLHPDLSATIGAERFEREIKLAAKLQHPHILGLYDSGTAGGLLYYVMPFIEGESVRDKLDRDKQLSVDEAIQITLEVADALGYAHAQNIVHRDIKPENVMMSNGHALVADFGIARARTEAGQSRLTQTGMAVGTPVYMSPEQSTGEPVGPTADIYSLGCMLYEMLAGEPPFTGSNTMAIMAKHAMEAVPSVRIVRPSVPEEVEEAILAAMEKAAADRPKTAAEFCEILGTPIGATAARRVTSRYTATRRAPTATRQAAYQAPVWWRRPAVILGGAAGAVGVVAAGLFLTLKDTSGAATVEGAWDARRIAVVYFDDLTPDKSLGYLADGLTETLIDQLKQVRDLDVVSRDAVGQFRGKDASTDSIASVLEAGTILRGSVSENSNRVRISFNVIDGNSGGDRADGKGFELPRTDLIAITQNVADSVGEYLRNVLGADIRRRELASGTNSQRAWTLVQRAEKLRKDAVLAAAAGDSATADSDFAQADALLAQAEGEDPKWVNPIALRSKVAENQARTKAVSQRAQWIDRGLDHAERALQLDSTSLDAHETRGRLRHLRWAQQTVTERQGNALLEGARDDLMFVIRRDKTRALAWVALSSVHSQLKDPFASTQAALNALEEDAYFSGVETIFRQLFATFHDQQEFTQAQRRCNEGATRFPRSWYFVSCKLLMRATKTVTSDADSAWRELATIESLLPAAEKEVQVRRHTMFVAATLALTGQKDSARRVMERTRAGTDIDPSGRLLTAEAIVRPLLGTAEDTVEAFKLLQRYVIGQPLHGKGFNETTHWWWKGLKADPRWREYLGAGTGTGQ